jgi:predicted dinucleotide-binding enzyme
MHVAIIGAGQVGSALAGALRRAGHTITFGSRVPRPGRTDETTIADAVREADATILAAPFAAVAEIIAAAGGFAGRVLIDATNPLAMREGRLGLTMGFDTSGAETIATLAPQAHLFKTFNQTGFENMADAAGYAIRPAMFVAGDDDATKPLVLRLVADAGFEAIDAGKLSSARLLEPLATLWIEMARLRGFGPGIAFTLQRKV